MRWIALCAVVLGGCQLITRVRASKVAIVTWLQQPSIQTAPFDQMPENGIITATAFFGQLSPTLQPQPQSGVFSAFFGAGKAHVMTEQAPESGMYIVTSLDDPTLTYDTDENHKFGFKACTDYRDG